MERTVYLAFHFLQQERLTFLLRFFYSSNAAAPNKKKMRKETNKQPNTDLFTDTVAINFTDGTTILCTY